MHQYRFIRTIRQIHYANPYDRFFATVRIREINLIFINAYLSALATGVWEGSKGGSM